MCEYKILHQSENGCVILCKQCSNIRLLFSTVSIDLTETQFYEFKDAIAQYVELNQFRPAHQRSIYIPTSAVAIHLLYSQNDLKELTEILEDAYLSLEVEKLMAEI